MAEQDAYAKRLAEWKAKKEQAAKDDQVMVVQEIKPVVVEEVIDVDQPIRHQIDDEEVQISTAPIIRELTYQTLYKLKSMKLLVFVRGQGWRHIHDIKDLYMAKIASNPEGNRVYVIGGARDSKSKVTVENVSVYHLQGETLRQENLAPMINPRASFGCVYVPKTNEIVVVGGYINGRLASKCERYNINTNTWSSLPDLFEAKASSSLCLLNERYLYCFGGLSRNELGAAFLTNSIEMLDLQSPMPRWEKLPLNLPLSGCDIGCVPIKNDQILVFGGWNKTAQKGVYIFSRKNQGSMLPAQHELQPNHS